MSTNAHSSATEQLTTMERIRRVAMTVIRAPFTRRACREVLFCATGAIAGVAGFFLVVLTLVPALAVSGSVLGTVVGLLHGGRRAIPRPPARRAAAAAAAAGDRRARPAARAVPAGRRRARAGWTGGCGTRDGWRAIGYAGAETAGGDRRGVGRRRGGHRPRRHRLPAGVGAHPQPPGGDQARPAESRCSPFPTGTVAIETWPARCSPCCSASSRVIAGAWLARGITAVDARLVRALLGPGRVSELERTRAIAVRGRGGGAAPGGTGPARRRAGPARGGRDEPGDGPGEGRRQAVRELLDAAQAGVGERAGRPAADRPRHPSAGARLRPGGRARLPGRVQPDPGHRCSADLPERPSPAIETIAYFCAAELLANAIKHSSANTIEIKIDTERPVLLRLRVTDDGRGGADPSRGTRPGRAAAARLDGGRDAARVEPARRADHA